MLIAIHSGAALGVGEFGAVSHWRCIEGALLGTIPDYPELV
jgi:hypothetical protein